MLVPTPLPHGVFNLTSSSHTKFHIVWVLEISLLLFDCISGLHLTRDFGWGGIYLESHCFQYWNVGEVLLFIWCFAVLFSSLTSIFLLSCGNLWLYKRQGRWAVISGRSHYLCHQEEWRWLVWGSYEWSDWALSRELRGVHHALFWVKACGRAVSLTPRRVRSSQRKRPWGFPSSKMNEGQMIKTT